MARKACSTFSVRIYWASLRLSMRSSLSSPALTAPPMAKKRRVTQELNLYQNVRGSSSQRHGDVSWLKDSAKTSRQKSVQGGVHAQAASDLRNIEKLLQNLNVCLDPYIGCGFRFQEFWLQWGWIMTYDKERSSVRIRLKKFRCSLQS